MPFWQRIAARSNPIRAWLFAMVIAVGTFIWAGFLGEGDLIAYGFVCLGSGIALGGELALPPAILAGMIHRHKQQVSATSWFAMMAFVGKFNLALAAGITFPFLELSGFQPGQTNPEAALQSLSVAYAFIPCVFKLLALVILWKFSKNLEYIERNSSEKNTENSNVRGDSSDYDRSQSYQAEPFCALRVYFYIADTKRLFRFNRTIY